MAKDLGLSSGWKGRMYQSFGKAIDWRQSVDIDFSDFGEGDGFRVHIIGSGIENHNDLNKVNGYNLSTMNPYSISDFNGHSTFISGIIAGNGKYFVKGIAPKAEVCAVKILDKNELTDFRTLETALLWTKDNFATVVLVDAEVYNAIPLVIKKAIDMLEESKIPVFILGKKNGKYDFNKYVTEFENCSCWIDNWYKKAENIDNSLAIAVGLSVLLKEKNPDLTTDELYSKIDSLLFPKDESKTEVIKDKGLTEE